MWAYFRKCAHHKISYVSLSPKNLFCTTAHREKVKPLRQSSWHVFSLHLMKRESALSHDTDIHVMRKLIINNDYTVRSQKYFIVEVRNKTVWIYIYSNNLYCICYENEKHVMHLFRKSLDSPFNSFRYFSALVCFEIVLTPNVFWPMLTNHNQATVFA